MVSWMFSHSVAWLVVGLLHSVDLPEYPIVRGAAEFSVSVRRFVLPKTKPTPVHPTLFRADLTLVLRC